MGAEHGRLRARNPCRADLGLLSKAMHQISQEVLPVLIAGAGLPQLPLMLKEDKLYAERLFAFRTIDSLSPPQAAKALTVPASRENVAYTPESLCSTSWSSPRAIRTSCSSGERP